MAEESDLERDCRADVLHAGGLLWKWVSPGRRGVPDDILILPGCPVVFVEFKAPGGKLRPEQQSCIDALESRGKRVWVISDRSIFRGALANYQKQCHAIATAAKGS